MFKLKPQSPQSGIFNVGGGPHISPDGPDPVDMIGAHLTPVRPCNRESGCRGQHSTCTKDERGTGKCKANERIIKHEEKTQTVSTAGIFDT